MNYNIYDEIDKLAYFKIVKIAPEYVQRNMLAMSLTLLEKRLEGLTLTEEELAVQDNIRSVWTRVNSIRAYAKYLKEEAAAGNNPDINSGWSE